MNPSLSRRLSEMCFSLTIGFMFWLVWSYLVFVYLDFPQEELIDFLPAFIVCSVFLEMDMQMKFLKGFLNVLLVVLIPVCYGWIWSSHSKSVFLNEYWSHYDMDCLGATRKPLELIDYYSHFWTKTSLPFFIGLGFLIPLIGKYQNQIHSFLKPRFLS